MPHGLRRVGAAVLLLALGSCSDRARDPASVPDSSAPARIDILGTQAKTYSQFDEDLIIRDGPPRRFLPGRGMCLARARKHH